MTTTAVRSFIDNHNKLEAWGRNRAALEEHGELTKKLNEEARQNWDSEAWHRQVAADIATNLDYGFRYETLLGQYIQVQTVGEFDRVVTRERRGLKVFFTSRGGYIDESQIRTEQWEMPRDTMGFHVSEHIDKLRANFATTIADLVGLGQIRMETEVNRRLLSLAQAAVPAGSPYYVASTGLTKAELDSAIRRVRDAIQPDSATGVVPVSIIGRASMIDKVADFLPDYSPVANEELRRQGFLGYYKGAQLIVLRNYADEDGKSFSAPGELWVVGGTAGKFALYGGVQVKAWDENTVDYRHYRARRDIGGLVNHPEQLRRIVDASET